VLVAHIYVGRRFYKAITDLFNVSPRVARWIVTAGVIFFNLWPLVIVATYLANGGQNLFLFDTRLHFLDFLLVFPYWWGLITVLEVVPYVLSLDILSLIIRVFGFTDRLRWPRWQSMMTVGMVVLFSIYAGYRIYWDTYHVRLDSVDVAVQNLPESLENLTLIFLGDIHIGRYTQDEKINQFQNVFKKADGDLFLFAGDLVTRGDSFIPRGIKELCNTQAPLGRIACMGDHDYWSGPQEISHGLIKCGWRFLENQHRVIHTKNHKILVTGVTYIYSERTPVSRLSTLFQNAPEADVKIVLVHQPSEEVMETAAKNGYHLMLAGHTHGGQIVFHPFGIPFTPSQFENRIYSGQGRHNGMQVVITNGIGLTLAPVRYHAPAEITKIRLVKEH